MNKSLAPVPPSRGKTASGYSLRLKKYGYLMFLLPMSLPLQSWWAAQQWGHWNLWAWHAPIVFFIVIPVLDALIGHDPANPDPDDETLLNADLYYRVLPLLCLPLYLAVLVFGAWVVATVPFS